MKFSAVIFFSFYFTTFSFAQYGDAYHAPDHLKLQQMRTAREAANRNAVSYNRNSSPAKSYNSSNASSPARAYTPKPAEKSFNDKLQEAYNLKLSKFNELAKGIEHTNENFDRLVAIAERAGFDNYTARRMLGYIDPANKEFIKNSDVGYSYKGNTQNGEPYGRGTFSFDNGDVLTADIADGLPHGKGIMRWKSGAVYKGDIEYGELTGMGTITTPDGIKYAGRFEKGELVEKTPGEITVMRGSKVNGKFNGDDIYAEWSSGEKFKGKAVDNIPTEGTITYPDGYVFTGKFKNPDSWTFGKVTTSEGESFEGSFKNNKKQYGKYVFASGNTATGRYSPDGKHLICGVLTNNKFTYEGEVIKGNKKQGYGKLVQKNGDVYEGEFIDDVQAGIGAYSFNTTKVAGKVFYKNKMIYGMAIVDGKPLPAVLNKDFTVSYLTGADADEASKYYYETMQYIETKKAAYEACLKIDGEPVKNKKVAAAETAAVEKKQPAKEHDAAKKKQPVKEDVAGERKIENKLKQSMDGNMETVFNNWDEAVAKMEWTNLEKPRDDKDIFRVRTEGMLVYDQVSSALSVTTGKLPTSSANWNYSARYGQIQITEPETAIGLVLETVTPAGDKAVTVCFMLNSISQQYWIGIYDAAKEKFTPLPGTGTDGKKNSSFINRYEDGKGADNRLSIVKKGTVLKLFINNQSVETIAITASNSFLKNLTGIGIATGYKGSGGIAEISFNQGKP